MRGRRTLALASLTLIGLTGCGAAGLPFGGGASSSFSSVAQPVSQADTVAQTTLLNAAAAVMVVSFDEGGGGFEGLTAKQVASLDPTMHVVGDVPAKVGVVSLNYAGPDGAVLSTKSKSGSVFCVALTDSAQQPESGSVDAYGATSVGDCKGHHWSLGF